MLINENLVFVCTYVTYPWIYVVTQGNGLPQLFFVPTLDYLHLQQSRIGVSM